MDELSVKQELFPMAQTPGASTLSEVFGAWKERGLEPVELTREETEQRITIIHDPLKGEIRWECSSNMDGLAATLFATEATVLMPLVIVGDTAKSICEYFASGDGRIDIGTGEAAVMIAFRNGRLVMDWTPKDAPIAAKKLLAMAFISMIAKDAGMVIDNIIGLGK